MLLNSIIVPDNHHLVGSDTAEHTIKAFQVFLVIIAENPVEFPYIMSQFMKTFANRKICGQYYLLMEDPVIFQHPFWEHWEHCTC